MDFWGALFVLFVLGAFVVLPAIGIALTVAFSARGARLKSLEDSHQRLEKRVLEMASRVRKLEGTTSTVAADFASASPAPAPADATSTISRLREHVRATPETAPAGAGRGESPLTPPAGAPLEAVAAPGAPVSGVVRIESAIAGAPIARAVSGPLPPDSSRAAEAPLPEGAGQPVVSASSARATSPDAARIEPAAGAPATGARPSSAASGAHPSPRPIFPPPPPPTPPSGPRGGAPGATPGVPLERLVGVLLTAGIGAVALGLAGLLFFQFAVKAGWIGPELRVILGTALGIASVAGSVLLERRTPAAANALAAGGVVVLYAAFWASHVRYHLVPMELAFALMAIVTAVTALLADRRKSVLTAVLGILGGFATPLLLTSGSNRPIELFGYVLLLDAAFLWVAWRRRWGFLAGFALLGSLLLQGLWLGTKMEPHQLYLALGITGVFAAVFAATGALAKEDDRWQWGLAQAGGVLAPFAFALFLASQRGLGDDFVPHAILLAFLSAAASWLGRSWKNPLLPLGAAAGAMATLAGFAIAQRGDVPSWETVGIALGLVAIFHFFTELDGDPPIHAIVPAALAALGFGFVLTILATVTPIEDPWPWIAGFAAIAALLLRQARARSAEALSLLPAAGFPIALAMLFAAHHKHAGSAPLTLYLLVGTAAAALLQGVSFLRRTKETRAFNDHAAVVIAVSTFALQPFLLELAGRASFSWRIPALSLAGAFLGLLASTRLKSGAWFVVTALALVFAQAFSRTDAPVFALLAASAVLVAAWPFLFPRAFRDGHAAWILSALAGALWFLPLRHQWIAMFGDRAIGALPLVLAAVALVGAFGARAIFADDQAAAIRRDLLAAFGAVALGFVALAVPLQLEKEWITVAWALQGVAVLWLWTKLDHAGLKYFGLALLGVVTVRLTLNIAVPQYHDRAVPVLNWILYTYWVPVVALLSARVLLARHEIRRVREWEGPLYPPNVALGADAVSLAAIAVVFVWINLAIADWFSAGEAVLWSWRREPERDVAMSIAWAVYGLVLLGIGMARRSVSLRWVSLAVLLLAIAKVFLYDLGELEDLHRVLSLLGLAVSLILVSFGYQRFVFRRPGLRGTPAEGGV